MKQENKKSTKELKKEAQVMQSQAYASLEKLKKDTLISEDALKQLDKVTWQLDEPFSNPTTTLNYIISDFASKTSKVVLSGVGGDEMFGGYPKYKALKIFNSFSKVPNFMIKDLNSVIQKLPDSTGESIVKAKRFFGSWKKEQIEQYISFVTYFSEKEKEKIKLHLIGKLQRNKAKDAIKLFDYIHSLDSQKLADTLSKYEMSLNKNLKYSAEHNKIVVFKLPKNYRNFPANDFIQYLRSIIPVNFLPYIDHSNTFTLAVSYEREYFVSKLFVANTHDTLLCFSSYGKVYWIKVYRLPRGGRNAKGRPIVNLLPLEKDERIQAVLPVKEFNDDQFIFMATETGSVKKTKLSAYSRPMKSGIKAIKLRDGDRVVNAEITDGTKEIMLFSNSGKSIRFKESDARPMGRVSQGVRGMRIDKDQKIISLVVLEEGNILVATENGYGKQTLKDEFSIQKRGGKGVIAIQTSDRNGNLIGAKQVSTGDEVMFISTSGNLIRTRTDDISIIGRNTQGVRLIRLSEDDNLLGMEKVISEDDEE